MEELHLKMQDCDICGIDEAGRGPLAGPVYAASVILPKDLEISGLNDSKKLTAKKREELFEIIKEKAVAYGIGFATEKEIDEINILQATFLAMHRAYENMNYNAEKIMVDGNRDPKFDIETELVIKGDSKIAAISAASILAKVSRDHFMDEIDKKYPQYGFSKHKGYGTKMHYDAIKKYGVLPIHRRSFLKNVENH